MADYYPLLARALDALPDRSPDMREAVYERARAALTGQLRSLDPPLSEEDIDAERRSLDAAIGRLEDEFGAKVPEPAAAAAVPGEAPAAAVAPAAVPAAAEPPPPSEPDLPEPGPPVALKLPEPERPRPVETAADFAPDDSPARQRPRIDVVRPKGDRSRLLRNGIVAAALAAVIGAIAAAAWSLRDTPATVQSKISENAAERPPEPQDSKFADRVGGERAPAAPPVAAAAPPPTRAGAPDITIAQRATLYEEAGGPNNGPRAAAGQVVWRLDAVNAGQGQPLQTVVRATAEAQEAGLTVAMVIRRNTDATLPASHVIELTFTPTDPSRNVRDVGLLQFKDDESARGSPVSGLPVPVRENIFLIGLSNLKGDIERNTDLMLRRNWIDLPIRYASGGRAILTFEKGSAGDRVMREAFEQWK
ncbi:hypothetical protein [Methylobacterium sp. WSM2598]|uniref:hypothetical protein n=1 Tax=Methylobacterium sp. WSM2598 TaxID=398261 RepID=UPI00037F37D0|nr:hypothetical protein [Methylobacterium sp. WSM2598]